MRLPPATAQLWSFIETQPLLKDFILIGGTALAMHLEHRLSEDLDFTTTQKKLPRAQLDLLLRIAAEQGHRIVRNDDDLAYDEFSNAGMDLHDYQQDFVVNDGVKLTFFTADAPLAAVLDRLRAENGPRVASEAELFRSKAILTISRTKLRDAFDLYFLLSRTPRYGPASFIEAFDLAGLEPQIDTALKRLTSKSPPPADEGYSALVDEAPTWEEMSVFFREFRDSVEILSASKRG